jgi:hypothetical protein
LDDLVGEALAEFAILCSWSGNQSCM